MERRSFIKKSTATAIIAASPLALTQLVRAADSDIVGRRDENNSSVIGCAVAIAGGLTTTRTFRVYGIPSGSSTSRWYCYKEHSCPNGEICEASKTENCGADPTCLFLKKKPEGDAW